MRYFDTDTVIDDALEQRLENWGRWSRMPPSRAPVGTLLIIEKLRLYSHTKNKDSEEELNAETKDAQPEIDEKDAIKIERALRLLPKSPNEYKKGLELLVLVYTQPRLSFDAYCRIVKLRFRDYAPVLRRTKHMLRNVLLMIEKVNKNG